MRDAKRMRVDGEMKGTRGECGLDDRKDDVCK